MKSIKVGVVGAGFAGVATCVELLKHNFSVTLIDIGQKSASTIAAGLLHRYSGLHAKLNQFGIEGQKKTEEFLKLAETSLNQSVILQKGILRIPYTDTQRTTFKQSAETFPDIELRDNGIFIKSGYAIDTALYLQGLLTHCKAHGLETKHTIDPNDYDLLIYCIGAQAANHPLFTPYKVHAVKGQLLILEWPKEEPPLSHPLVEQVYITMTPDKTHCIVGATYEHTFSSLEPTSAAIDELLPKAIHLLPFLNKSKVVEIKAALRASVPGRLPLITQVDPKTWLYTGLGSKGLLYHGLFAEKLAYIFFQQES